MQCTAMQIRLLTFPCHRRFNAHIHTKVNQSFRNQELVRQVMRYLLLLNWITNSGESSSRTVILNLRYATSRSLPLVIDAAVNCIFCRDGTAISSLPTISQDMARSLLKGSVQSIAAHAGYEEMTTSCLNGLTGITRNFLESFSKCLRGALDCEAETGNWVWLGVIPFHEELTSNAGRAPVYLIAVDRIAAIQEVHVWCRC